MWMKSKNSGKIKEIYVRIEARQRQEVKACHMVL